MNVLSLMQMEQRSVPGSVWQFCQGLSVSFFLHAQVEVQDYEH